ncbi:hypothetical protein ET495_05810 [Xylanimonas allomyrinae]|uniref:Uncharacterized protein n=1 Tax=Xylanimonas allomyrinae TaxID=2509459 RepID=A0A4P6EM90_9MICO|nr:hypothetical protein [Xylanimonas allomyrinae]QAY62843.1 hypothetical protein ET495_05810 [Xylanimonas allomyrinae]
MPEQEPKVRSRGAWPWTLVVGLALLAYLVLSSIVLTEVTPLQVLALPTGIVLATIGVVTKIRADLRGRGTR